MTVTAPRPSETQPSVRRLTAVTVRRTPKPDAAHDLGVAIATVATMVALVCLWVAAQMLWFGGISESRDQRLLYDQFRTELAAATAPVGPVTPPGDPVALLTIPRLGVQQVVVEGTASGDLLAGPGHLRDTVLPGQVGTSVVFGRAATYGAPFQNIASLQRGDQISVIMAQGQRIFHVIGVRRAGDPLPQPPASGLARLTLVSAEGSGRFGDIAPGQAVYVDAEATKGFQRPRRASHRGAHLRDGAGQRTRGAPAPRGLSGTPARPDPRHPGRATALVRRPSLGDRFCSRDRSRLVHDGCGDAVVAQPDVSPDP